MRRAGRHQPPGLALGRRRPRHLLGRRPGRGRPRRPEDRRRAVARRACCSPRGATINAKPELEIFADDVKCAHGATVGELDRDALFYMASRGVPEPTPRRLLTRAFVADAIDRVGEEKVREAFHADAEGWLG